MTLNPITALSEQIQKLINERGSAVILRDHLALFKDQVILLEKDNVKLSSENVILKRKLEEFESKINQLIKDNEELRGKIQKNEHTSHNNLLDENKIKILIFLSNQQNKLQAEEISRLLNINIQIVKFHLEELEEQNKMVHGTIAMGQRRLWSLVQEGRRYLIENKLIS